MDLHVNNKGLKLQTAKEKVEIKKLQKCLQEKQKKLKHSIMNIWKLGNWPVIFSKSAKDWFNWVGIRKSTKGCPSTAGLNEIKAWAL